nr:MAG TPA: hypothetical protein [Caudoviricetes sp.]
MRMHDRLHQNVDVWKLGNQTWSIPLMYPKMELVEYNIAISKCINGKSSKVDHHLFSFLVFPKAMPRDATVSQHIVNCID